MDTQALVERRFKNVRSILDTRGLDAILLVNPNAHAPQGGDYSLYYLSNLYQRYLGYLVLTRDECAAWVEASEVRRARADSWLATIEPLPAGDQPLVTTGDELGRLSAKQLIAMTGKDRPAVGVSGRNLPATVAMALIDAGMRLANVDTELEQVRMIKDALELELLRVGCELADRGVAATMRGLVAGVTERELAAAAEYEMKAHGADCFWWKTLMSSGPDAERWLTAASDRVIGEGDLVVTDFTPVYRGYAGDIARSFVCGKASAEQMEVFNLARAALDATAEAAREGVTGGELMRAGARPVRGSRYEPYYIGAGHGIGLYDDTFPIFMGTNAQLEHLPAPILNQVFTAGMVLALEIIFTVPGLGGVRLEDNYLVTRGAPERLTHAPIVAEVFH